MNRQIVSVEVDGKEYFATYVCDGLHVTLLYENDFADCRVDGINPNDAAKILLRNLVSSRLAP